MTAVQNTTYSPKPRFSSPLVIPRASASSKKKGGGSGKLSRAKASASTSIKECLASLERNQQQDKQECPVCQVLVTAKYLNIHLDKCLTK